MELISKEEVLKAFCPVLVLPSDVDVEPFVKWCNQIIGDIKALPTIESRPKGKWIEKSIHDYYCSNCDTQAGYYVGNPFGTYEIFQNLSDFCPECGADMRGE